MTNRSCLVWRVASDGTVSLLSDGAVVALAYPDGRRWRVAAADDGRPGNICPTLDEAKAAAMILARNRMAAGRNLSMSRQTSHG